MSQAFLSNDQLRQMAPTVFAPAPHASRSERYAYIPTADIVDGLHKEGFAPVKVAVSRVKPDSGRQGFERHLLRFRLAAGGLATVGDVFPEVILINSHDGSSAYQLSAGLHRLVCSNGLAVSCGGADDSIRVMHTGKRAIEDIIEGSFKVLERAKLAATASVEWRNIQLALPEQQAFAQGALVARFGDADGQVHNTLAPAALLTARRSDDVGNDLWRTFNRVQENAIRGGMRYRTEPTERSPRGRRGRAREVQSIDKDLSVNRALWAMAAALAANKTQGTPIIPAAA